MDVGDEGYELELESVGKTAREFRRNQELCCVALSGGLMLSGLFALSRLSRSGFDFDGTRESALADLVISDKGGSGGIERAAGA
jgi:hypothetical protein